MQEVVVLSGRWSRASLCEAECSVLPMCSTDRILPMCSTDGILPPYALPCEQA